MSAPQNTLKWNTADRLGVAVSLDSVRRPGFYDAISPQGLADGNYHIMVMKGLDAGAGNYNTKQIAYQVGSGTAYVRDFNGATWSSWTSLGGGSGSDVDLAVSNRTSTGFNVAATNDIGTGTAAPLPLATSSLAGLLSATDKAKIDALPVGFVGIYASMAALQTAIPTSTNGYYAVLLNAAADPSFAVWDDDTSAWVEASGVTVGTTNLSINGTDTTVTIESDTGDDATLPVAGNTEAGIITATTYKRIFNLRIYNVLNYGADNSGDSGDAAANRTAFENAILDCDGDGGGIIYAPQGIYYISYGGSASVGGVRLRSNMALVGDGIGNTIIRAADIGNNDMAGLVRTQSGIENANVSVRDLTIDGNKAEQTGWANIICFFAGVTPDNRTLFDTDIWCVNVECKNGKNGTTGSSNLSRGYGFDPHESVKRFAAVNCIAHDCERDGFVLDGVIDFSLIGCKSWDNGRHGFNFITETFNGVVQGCHAWDNVDNNYVVQGDSHHINFLGNHSRGSGKNGFRIRRGGTVINTHILLMGNIIMEAQRNGIQLTGANHNVINGNLFLNNSQAANNTYFDVSLDEDDGDTMTFTGAQYNIVQNNHAVALASNKTKAAYREDDAASVPPTSNTFMWNTATGQVSGKYDDGISSTSKIIDYGYLTVYDVAGHDIVGDNSAENGTKIRNLVNLVAARGGGIIKFGPGTFLMSGTGTASQGCIALPSNVHLKGDGMGTTVLKAVDPVNNTLTGIVRTKSGATNTNISVSDLTIDAQTCSGTGDITSLYVGGSSDGFIYFNELEVKGGQNGTSNLGYGVRVTASAYGVYLSAVYAHHNERDNIYFDGASWSSIIDSISEYAGRHNANFSNGAHDIAVQNLRAANATTNGVFISEDAYDIRFNGGVVKNSGEDGFRIRRGSTLPNTHITIDHMLIETNGRDGISFAGSGENAVRCNTFRGNGTAANNTYADVSFELDSSYTSTKAERNYCAGNLHIPAASGNKVDYFYAERTSAGDLNVVLWNYFTGSAATANYLLASASTTVFRDHTSSPLAAGSDNQVQYNNGGVLGGDAGLTIDETNHRPRAISGLVAGTPASAAAPSTGEVVFQAATRGGAALPAFYKAREHIIQPALFDRAWGQFVPNFNSTTLVVPGFANTTVGTATARAPSTGAKLSQAKRVGYDSSGTSGNAAGVRQSSRGLYRGSAAGTGGFTVHIVFGFNTTPTAPRVFVGLYGAASEFAVIDGDPNGRTNLVGIGCDVGDTNLYVYTNDGSGAPAEVNLGANFPITSGAMYELFLHCEPNGSAIEYYVRRLDSAQVAQGTLSSDLPAATTVMAPQCAMHNGATAEVVGIDIVSMYYEMPL